MSTKTLTIVWNVTVVLAIGVYLSRFPHYPTQSILFPRLISYPVLVFCLWSLLAEGIRFRRNRQKADESRVDGWALVTPVIGGVVYLVLWNTLGFMLDSVLFISLFPFFAGYGPIRLLPITFGVGVAVGLLFTFLFHLGSGAILPQGILNWGGIF